MHCLFSSKTNNNNQEVPPPRASQYTLLNRGSAPSNATTTTAATPSVNSQPRATPTPPKEELDALEKKVNDLMNLQANFNIKELENSFRDLQTQLDMLKKDMAKEMGYPLAIQLINEVSDLCDPNVDKYISTPPRAQPNPWGWMTRKPEFRKFTEDSADLLPRGINSVEDITSTAARITAQHNNKNQKSLPEQIYLELRSFKERGYLEALRTADPDLHGFLCLSEWLGNQFIAGPRLLHLTAHLLLRAKMDIAYLNRQPKDKILNHRWEDRWRDAEVWFQTVLDCIVQRNIPDDVIPRSEAEIAKEFDVIEETCRQTKSLPSEAHSFDKIARYFKDINESGLLTNEMRHKYLLCCTLLESALKIRDKFKVHIMEKRGKERAITPTPRDGSGRVSRNSGTTSIKLKLDPEGTNCLSVRKTGT